MLFRSNVDIHENNLSFQEKVRRVYLMQESFDRDFVVIPCGNEQGEMSLQEEVSQKILKVVQNRLKI